MLKSARGYNAQSIFTIIFLVVISAVTVGYAAFQAEKVVAGPEITFTSHTQSQIVSESPITLRGYIDRVSFIELNGRQIFVNEDGFFEETLLLAPGNNTIEITVTDRFGRERVERLYLFYKTNETETNS